MQGHSAFLSRTKAAVGGLTVIGSDSSLEISRPHAIRELQKTPLFSHRQSSVVIRTDSESLSVSQFP